ncbi:hypothetical protein [Chryseolinea lacunae]|uniref:DUF304 domain-containing protein n=1 Tax=Chryseolinea lacunae TaxID=2801331 RepID=A0ABS1KTJ0_9BACT|nr:hypothetical protein [Chryseolinea lacunae]MBL0742734.1 hypothetical protein [Chryseolinea lacunae]
MMITEFVSTDQDFSSRVSKLYLRLALLHPVLAFWLVVLVYSIVYHEGRARRTKLDRIIEGLSYMSATSVVVFIVVVVILVVVELIWLRSYYGKREIVVGLKFNDALKELTLKTKTTSGWEFTKVHKYKDLSFYKDNLSDGMTTSYNTLTLAKGDEVVGHILMNHFTWDIKTQMEIEAKLRSAK